MVKSMPMPRSEKVTFAADGHILSGSLHLPAAPRPPIVIGSHGLYSSSQSPKQIHLARKCNELGIAYFRFDHRGCGDSQGSFESGISIAARCTDLACAAQSMLAMNKFSNNIGLFGSSMGGAASICAFSELKASAMVTFAAPLKNGPIIEALQQDGAIDPQINLNDVLFDLTNQLTGLKNILVFHGSADDVVPPSHAETLYTKASAPKELIIQSQGDHRMSDPAHQKTFVKKAAFWFNTHLRATHA